MLSNYVEADKQGLQRRVDGCALFSNMASAVGYKVVLIQDYLHSTFHIFVFSHVLLEVIIRTSNSKNVLFIKNRFKIIINSKCEISEFSLLSTLWVALEDVFSLAFYHLSRRFKDDEKLLHFIMTNTNNRFAISFDLGYVLHRWNAEKVAWRKQMPAPLRR